MPGLELPPPPPGGYEWPVPVENSRQMAAMVISSVNIVVPTLLVGLRIFAKWRSEKSFDRSDVCIFMALIINYGLQVNSMLLVTHGGLGISLAESVSRFGFQPAIFLYKAYVSHNVLWNCATVCSKLSVLLLYTNLIPVRSMILPAGAMMTFVVMSHASYIIAQFLICQPSRKAWDPFIPGHCGDITTVYIVAGITNIVADVVILVLPMPFIYSLTLERMKKAILAGMFAVGFLTSGISIYRQTRLPEINIVETTSVSLMIIVLTALEPAVAVTLACIPYLRPLTHRRSHARSPSDYETPYMPRKPETGGGRASPWRNRASSAARFRGLVDGPGPSHFDSSQVELQLVKVESDPSTVMSSRQEDGGLAGTKRTVDGMVAGQ
ncbi:hypothetical protein Micbo1qcDRAFT_207014 [Microdochium bolleyi]|uniref:Rhodopsin domain-containing protein n=1 Tax=Microdochium bolleyi TaxID=196109 RepID=A0A136IVT0_9PEZI|nr:hypothetical protein Micbo1qcDRAFT_207014 [Microdochium bolleyi]